MPANVPAASPSVTMPAHLCRAFERVQEWAGVEENVYQNGERQSRARTTTPALRWRLSAIESRFSASLLSFIAARKGVEPFFYVDPSDDNTYTVIASAPVSSSRTIGGRAVVEIYLEQRA